MSTATLTSYNLCEELLVRDRTSSPSAASYQTTSPWGNERRESFPEWSSLRELLSLKERNTEVLPFTKSALYAPKVPRTDALDLMNFQISLLRNLTFKGSTEDLAFGINLKNEVIIEIETKGLDMGVRYLLQNLKKNLLVNEYSKCNTFIKILTDSIYDFDTRVHICVLTLTSHWKKNLSARNNYYLSVEQFVNNSFKEVRAKQILFGLE